MTNFDHDRGEASFPNPEPPSNKWLSNRFRVGLLLVGVLTAAIATTAILWDIYRGEVPEVNIEAISTKQALPTTTASPTDRCEESPNNTVCQINGSTTTVGLAPSTSSNSSTSMLYAHTCLDNPYGDDCLIDLITTNKSAVSWTSCILKHGLHGDDQTQSAALCRDAGFDSEDPDQPSGPYLLAIGNPTTTTQTILIPTTQTTIAYVHPCTDEPSGDACIQALISANEFPETWADCLSKYELQGYNQIRSEAHCQGAGFDNENPDSPSGPYISTTTNAPTTTQRPTTTKAIDTYTHPCLDDRSSDACKTVERLESEQPTTWSSCISRYRVQGYPQSRAEAHCRDAGFDSSNPDSKITTTTTTIFIPTNTRSPSPTRVAPSTVRRATRGWQWCQWYPDTIAVCPITWEVLPHDGFTSAVREHPPTGWRFIMLTIKAKVNEETAPFGTFDGPNLDIRTLDGLALDSRPHDWGGDCNISQQVTSLAPAVCQILYQVPSSAQQLVMSYKFSSYQISEWLLNI